MNEYKFNVGDYAYKSGGSYQAWGVVRSTFLTRNNETRVVFDFEEPAGMLHIFNEQQLLTVDEFNNRLGNETHYAI